jgi:hypothetical protein
MTNGSLRTSPTAKASLSNDGLVLLDTRAGLVLAANPIGARIWQLIDEGRTRDEIARSLSFEYGIPADDAARDVDGFVSALAARQLIVEQR